MKNPLVKMLMPLTLLTLSGVSCAFANSIVLTQDAYSYGQGGEFNAVTSQNFLAGYAPSTTISGGFETFCIETTVEFTPGTIYSYTLGSSDATAPGIPLTEGAAYLYYEFAKGVLTGYDYTDTAGRLADAGLLQAALWYLQGGQVYNADGSLHNNPTTDGNPFYALALSMFDSGATNANNGTYGVEVLQMWGANGTPAQNQLVLTPVPDNSMTAMLLGIGLVGMYLVQQKLRKSDQVLVHNKKK
ncbi:MAG TPA: hypothetical protein VFC85_03760 [Verrucomicrobiae bacterium]|nr:hypothetical protein [Verrucomicrobiae bacterium]